MGIKERLKEIILKNYTRHAKINCVSENRKKKNVKKTVSKNHSEYEVSLEHFIVPPSVNMQINPRNKNNHATQEHSGATFSEE